jgi:hypothetical protein
VTLSNTRSMSRTSWMASKKKRNKKCTQESRGKHTESERVPTTS